MKYIKNMNINEVSNNYINGGDQAAKEDSNEIPAEYKDMSSE